MFRRRPKMPPHSAARQALADLHRQISEEQDRIVEIEQRLARFASAEAAATAIEADLHRVVAKDGGRQLCSVATGNGGTDPGFAALLGKAEDARRAAELARRSKPQAEAELTASRAELAELQKQMPGHIAAVLKEAAEPLGEAYQQAFRHLARLHHRLAGVALALDSMGESIAMSGEDIVAPRFKLASLTAHLQHYEPMLVATVSERTVDQRVAADFRDAARALEQDPRARLDHLVADRPA